LPATADTLNDVTTEAVEREVETIAEPVLKPLNGWVWEVGMNSVVCTGLSVVLGIEVTRLIVESPALLTTPEKVPGELPESTDSLPVKPVESPLTHLPVVQDDPVAIST
jgi:hypothetical protein